MYKGSYSFVPQMIRYYLHEELILQNTPTYLPYFKKDQEYILSHIEKLAIKDVSEVGGYGVVFGANLSKDKLEELKHLIKTRPRRWIAQEIIDFVDLSVSEDGKTVMRKADLRAYVLSGENTNVWLNCLTCFAREEGSFVVNSSQGEGYIGAFTTEKTNN